MRDVKLSPAEIRDSGKVRLGNMSPSLPAARPASAETADNGKVRMGNMSPSFPAAQSSAATADSGKVRLGQHEPEPAGRSPGDGRRLPTAARFAWATIEPEPARPLARRRPRTADNGKVRLGNMRPAL